MIPRAALVQRTLVSCPYGTSAKAGSKKVKPLASQVLTSYLIQTNMPPWTSYFVKYSDVVNDQSLLSHFNWKVGDINYHILRTGCFPYIKYHCTQRPWKDLTREDRLIRAIKLFNFGIPTLMYGLGALLLISHKEIVKTPCGDVPIYFLIEENKGSFF